MITPKHQIQLQILHKLTLASKLKYSEMRPLQVENDLYNYHLQYLVKSKFIEKENDFYTLSTLGKNFITNMSADGQVLELFKVSVIIYLTRTNKDKKEILLQKRLRQPFLGDICSISGKIYRGEGILEAADRKLFEETGLSSNLKFIGIIRKIRWSKKLECLEDTFYHVFKGTDPKGSMTEKNEYGENFWSTFEQAEGFYKNNKDLSLQSIKVIRQIEKESITELFYYEDETILEEY